MKARMAFAATTVAALAFAPAALGQAPVIQAVDSNLTWTPATVTVNVGDTVTWRFTGTQLAHNVKSTTPNWTPQIDTPTSTSDPRDVSFTFAAEGTYEFVCKFHADTMKGTVTVGSPPPPPPPPLSEQPWANDQQPPSVFDVADEERPRVSRVRVAPVADGARVRFRLSERARVRVRFKKAGLTVKTARRWFGAGAHRLTVRDRRMRGAYRVEVIAWDRAGNRSRTTSDRVSIR
jgi:plastocyanin